MACALRFDYHHYGSAWYQR